MRSIHFLCLLLPLLVRSDVLVDDLSELANRLEAAKQAEKEASKEFHKELSKRIEENIHEIGEKIKAVISEFNATKNVKILEDARNGFKIRLANAISKLKELKKEFKAEKGLATDPKTKEAEKILKEVASIVSSSRKELADVLQVQPKDLRTALSSLNGARSWETISWLLLALSILLIVAVAVLYIKQRNINGNYKKLERGNGGRGGVFVPHNAP